MDYYDMKKAGSGFGASRSAWYETNAIGGGAEHQSGSYVKDRRQATRVLC